MSKIEVNAVEPQSGTTLTLGASGDTITIPAGATISNSGTAAGFGPTGAVSWNTTKITADPNPAVSGVGYFADTTSAAFTITLPSTPSAGAVVGIADYANTFATNNITVGRNGSNIGGVAENATLYTNGVSVTFVYVDATQGWIVTDSGSRSDLPTPEYVAATGGTVCTSGDYKIHTFTGPGTFTVTSAGNPAGSTAVDYLVVAGGGGGGGFYYAGGGGAGGFRESVPSPAAWTASPLANPGGALPVIATTYPITVGAGGGFGATNTAGASGGNSIFSTITSAGGGGGGSGNSCNPLALATAGGSGGGQGAITPAAPLAAGNTPPVNPPQGQPGGNFTLGPNSGDGGLGAGGGGATQAGNNPTTNGSSPAAAGGNGTATSISGSPIAYSGGGGGGGNYNPSIAGGAGGTGGGGSGAGSSASVAGTANRGGGGGGGSHCGNPNTNGSAGGSGVVVIRYKFQ